MIRATVIGALSSQRTPTQVVTERNITGVGAQSPRSFPYNTSWATVEASLPAVVTASLDDGTLAPLSIDWLEGTYNPVVADTYSIDGDLQLITGITNSTNIKGNISVTVEADVTFDVYMSPSGDDGNDGLSVGQPVLNFSRAITVAQSLGGERTIKMAAGTYTLSTTTGRITLPPLISLEGNGMNDTFIVSNATLNDSPPTFSFNTGRFLIQLSSGSTTAGNQRLRNFTMTGNKSGTTRLTHGAVFITNRTNVTLQNVTIDTFISSGTYFSTCSNCRVTDCDYYDSGYVAGFALGDIMLNGSTDIEVDNCLIDDIYGYGLKAFGGSGTVITRLKFHNNTVSVPRVAQFSSSGTAISIGAELHDCRLIGCEFYSNLFYAPLSLVTTESIPSNGIQTVRVYNNVFDLNTVWNGSGTHLEFTVHDGEIDHNYFVGGQNACIAIWNASETTVKRNWLIHHNVVDNMAASNPSGFIRSSFVGLQNVNAHHNVMYKTTQRSNHFFFIENGNNRNPAPSGSNITARNNLLYNGYTGMVNHGGDTIVRLVGGATLQNFIWTHNCVFGMSTSIPSGTQSNNITSNPLLSFAGAKPDPFFRPLSNSPLIEAGINVGLPFTGTAPTIGAYQFSDAVSAGDIDSVENFQDVPVHTGTAFGSLVLPSVANVALDNGQSQQLAITWASGSPAYDGDTPGTYTLIGTLTLLTGITNTGNLTATIDVVVSDAVYTVEDIFDRVSLGSDWTLQDPSGIVALTATLNGSYMLLDGDDGLDTERVVHTSFVDNTDNIKITMVHTIVELSATSYGIGVGLQNVVSPDPNKGVHVNFNTSTSANSGLLTIVSGDGTTSNSGFIAQQESDSQLSLVIDRSYETIIMREKQGTDALWTASTRDMVTDTIIEKQWLEIGAGSMLYQSTNKLAIFHFGGLQRVDSIRVEQTDSTGLPPNIIINEFFTGTSLVGWTEQDAGNFNTLTFLNPGLQIAGNSFQRASKNIAYDTPIGSSVTNWRITAIYRYTGSAARSISIGTKNVVGPDPNHFVTATLSFVGTGETGEVFIWNGNGAAGNDNQTNQTPSGSSTALTPAADTNFVLQFEREYDGTDAIYTATAWREDTPGTTVTVQWTETAANTKSQLYYNTSNWILGQISGTSQVDNYKVELL